MNPAVILRHARLLMPGLLIVASVAMAAQFIADHYGAPVMLMAILLGIPLQFLSEEPKTAPGIHFAARVLLRIGVALLGLRISFDMVAAIGWAQVAYLTLGVAATILLSVAVAPLMGKDRLFGFFDGRIGGHLRRVRRACHQLDHAQITGTGSQPVFHRDLGHGAVDHCDDPVSDFGAGAWP